MFNGVRLHYETAGSGEPIIFVHGSWTDHHSWDLVMPMMADTFKVVSFDRRGHSASEAPAGQGSIGEDVADLAAVIEALGPTPTSPATLSGR
jgi:pimeloyl-ACP methyl ester carboxylesterase